MVGFFFSPSAERMLRTPGFAAKIFAYWLIGKGKPASGSCRMKSALCPLGERNFKLPHCRSSGPQQVPEGLKALLLSGGRRPRGPDDELLWVWNLPERAGFCTVGSKRECTLQEGRCAAFSLFRCLPEQSRWRWALRCLQRGVHVDRA